ncbi:MAG: sigma-54 dependent transcriptional regulator, partial [bacterium]
MKREAEKTIKARVLVVDDDRLILRMLQTFLDQKGFESVLAADGEEAEKFFAAEEFDVVLADVLMPKMDGIQLLERIHEKDPEIPVIMITASGQINTAYEAMKKGAYDYIPKPFNNEDLYQRLLRAIEKFALVKRNRQLSEAVEKKFHFDNIIGVSGQMEEVFRLIRNVAVSNASILIQGESGTGKELVAGAIHNHSRRKEHPFIAVNCAAIPKELMESELFGHVKGSFTGAITDKKGRFELADGGTIFLDEIGDLDISLQAKILRALQEREFERVGGTQPIKVDIRLIA